MNSSVATWPSPYTATKTQLAYKRSAKYWGKRFSILILLGWAAGFLIGFQSSLAMLTAVALAAAVAGLRWPPIGLFGIGMLCTMDALMRVFLMTGGLFRWNTLNFWLLVVMLGFSPFLLRLADIQVRLFEVFILLLVIELAVSPEPSFGVLHILNIVILFGLIIYFARAAEDDNAWYWLGIVNGTLAAAGGLLFFLQQRGLPDIDYNAWVFFPLTAIFSICMAFGFAGEQLRKQVALASLAAVNFVWVFISGSRGGLLISVFCLIFLITHILRARARGLSRRYIILIAVLLLGFGVMTQFSEREDSSLSRFEKLLNSRETLRNRTSGRSDLMIGGWYIFLDHPAGVGTGGFKPSWASLGRLEGLSGFAHGKQKAAHSAWMKTLVENGLPGFLLLAGYVFSFVLVGWRKRQKRLLGLGFLVTSTLGFAFVSTEFQSKGLWFLTAGVTVLLHREQIVARLHHKRPPLLVARVTPTARLSSVEAQERPGSMAARIIDDLPYS